MLAVLWAAHLSDLQNQLGQMGTSVTCDRSCTAVLPQPPSLCPQGFPWLSGGGEDWLWASGLRARREAREGPGDTGVALGPEFRDSRVEVSHLA